MLDQPCTGAQQSHAKLLSLSPPTLPHVQMEAGDQAAATSNLQDLLKRSAGLHTSLVELAQAAAVEIPEEATLLAGGGKASDEPPGPRILQWSDFVAAGAADWEDFEDEGESWAVWLPLIGIEPQAYCCS